MKTTSTMLIVFLLALVFVAPSMRCSMAGTSAAETEAAPCIGPVENLSPLWGVCTHFPELCVVLNHIFGPCPANPRPDHLLAWWADGALIPPPEDVHASPFFFSLRVYDDGEVVAAVATVTENFGDQYERFFRGAEHKDIREFLQRLHISRAQITSQECPKLRRLARKLERLRVLNGPSASIVIHPTTVLFSFGSGGNKSVRIEDNWVDSELRTWAGELRAAIRRFLPKPEPL